jgi:hypothetical protein
MNAKMTKEAVFTFRLSVETKRALEKAAEAELRPMSAQAEMILRQWLKAKGYIQ